jgi:tetratricopeptide (TPR) repeat protein
LLQENSEDFESWYEKGMLLAETGDTVNAIQALERSFVLQPIQLSGLALANLYAETKNPNTLLVCDALLKKDTAGETIDPVFIKGIYYNNIHEPDRAIEQFDECIKRDWKFTEAYIEKGITQFLQKNMDAALKTFELAATVSNTNPDAYYWQGRCYEAIGKKEDALNNYVRALALDKKFVQARQGIERLRGSK